MLLGRPYDAAVDWWQLGIITYQMLTRQSPFQGEDEDEIYDTILADEPPFPTNMTSGSIDFIQNLLSKDPETRLGSGASGAEKVMAHAFFDEINWDDFFHKRVPAPFIPTVANRVDCSNFDSEFDILDTSAILDSSESTSSKPFDRVITNEPS
jgi:serine/threonine protein kinase